LDFKGLFMRADKDTGKFFLLIESLALKNTPLSSSIKRLYISGLNLAVIFFVIGIFDIDGLIESISVFLVMNFSIPLL